MKKIVFFFSVAVVALSLTSCMLIRDNMPPVITNFTTSSTLLSRTNISFSADVIDTGSGLSKVVFEIDGSPLPTSQKGTSLYVANWYGVYGSHKVVVLAEDRAGNLSEKKDSFFVADSTPPIVEVSLPKTVAVGVRFPITVKAYDLQSGVKSVSVTIDGEKVPLISNNIDWIFTNVGTHKISVTAVNGRGLVTTRTFEINSINARKVPPYVQFVKWPGVVKSGKNATFTVYAYSPNGIGKVYLSFDKSKRISLPNANNVYNFVIKIPNVSNGVYQATCTVVDGVGIKKTIHESIVALSKDSTVDVMVPKFSAKSVIVKIPFFVGTLSTSVRISALVDGIPVSVGGSFPKMFAVAQLKPGEHTLGIALNGKVFKTVNFSSKITPVKIVRVSKTSTEITIEFSNRVEIYANPVFVLSTGGTSTVLIDKKDVVVNGKKVSFPLSMLPASCVIRTTGLRDLYGRVVKASFDIPTSVNK